MLTSFLNAATEVVIPVAHDKAEGLLPVSKAAFAQVRATNAELRASDAMLAESNAQSVAALEAAEAKLQQLFPVSLATFVVILVSEGQTCLTMSLMHDHHNVAIKSSTLLLCILV